jgi:uncharacterized protein
MKKNLQIGNLIGGSDQIKPFTLPLDSCIHTFGVIAIRGAGKTVLATVMAEEFCECGLPFVALDPVGVWWGLRCKPDGKPGGYPVVVFGGAHGDLPLDKNGGARIADAILSENVPCIIDMSGESKNVWRKFTADFCDRLMEVQSEPRHIFIEEAPEFVPQKPMGEQKRSLAAVDRLIRLGRNFGYGATLLSQRYATVQKDCLTQCESLFALRSIGKPDRKAAAEWISEVAKDDDPKKAEKFVLSLTKLDDGEGWFWSPQWLDKFVHMQIRERKTFHPGATRKLGDMIVRQVALLDVGGFVERFKQKLTKAVKQDVVKNARKTRATPEDELAPALEVSAMEGRIKKLEQDLETERIANRALRHDNKEIADRLTAVRDMMKPQYETLQELFGELTEVQKSGLSGIDPAAYNGWREKLGPGPSKILDALVERGGVATKIQLKTWTALARETFRVYMSKLTSNHLVKREGDKYRLTQ